MGKCWEGKGKRYILLDAALANLFGRGMRVAVRFDDGNLRSGLRMPHHPPSTRLLPRGREFSYRLRLLAGIHPPAGKVPALHLPNRGSPWIGWLAHWFVWRKLFLSPFSSSPRQHNPIFFTPLLPHKIHYPLASYISLFTFLTAGVICHLQFATV